MPTFLWHQLTPKFTWPSQNKPKKNSQKIRGQLFPQLCPLLHPGGGHNCGNYCTLLFGQSKSEGNLRVRRDLPVCWGENLFRTGKSSDIIYFPKTRKQWDLDFHKITLPLLTPELNILSSISAMHVQQKCMLHTAVLPWQIWNCAVRNTKWLLAANPCYELAEIQWINRVGMSGQIGCATKSAPATT